MNLSLIAQKRVPLGEFHLLDDMLNKNDLLSRDAGMKLLASARDHGVGVRDYLEYVILPEGDRNGFELALEKLNLPVRNKLSEGMLLQAAGETFQTYSGTRALFPEVIDNIVRWKNRQDQIERLEPMVAGTRTITGNEVIATWVEDDSKDRSTYSVAEGARIPVRSLRTSQTNVKMNKVGSGYRMTYEFSRRANLDLITPFIARQQRELERAKVAFATTTLINGDGVNGAAVEVDQSSFNTPVGTTATAGQISWRHLTYWLVQMAKAGTPVDTLVMNWDGLFQYMMLFGAPLVQANSVAMTGAEAAEKAGLSLSMGSISLLQMVRPVVSSAVPTGKIIGITRDSCIEELVEAGSQINEAATAIENQTYTVYRTENVGIRLLFGDARQVYDFAN